MIINPNAMESSWNWKLDSWWQKYDNMFKMWYYTGTLDLSEFCVSHVLELQNESLTKKTLLCFCPTFT